LIDCNYSVNFNLKLEILEHKELLQELIRRDFKLRYSGSFLGFLWYLFEPLILMAIMVFMFTIVFPMGIPNFAVFFLIGFTVLRFFSFGTEWALDSIVTNSSLVKALYLPREIFPVSRIILALITTLFDLIVIFIFMIIFGIPFQIMCLFIPLILILEFIIVLGTGLILSALYVRWRDLSVIWGLIQTLLFWILPIFYSTEDIPSNYQFIHKYNPLALLIENLRAVILDGNLPNFLHLLYILVSGLILLSIGILLFNRRKKTFAEEI